MKRATVAAAAVLAAACGCSNRAAAPQAPAAAGQAPSPAGPAAGPSRPSGKPVMAPYAIEVAGPAAVVPGRPFKITATVRADQAAEGIQVRIEAPAGAGLEGAASRTVTAGPGAPAAVEFTVSVPDNGFYRFAVFATRPREAASAAFEVGTAPKMKPAGGGRILETRDGKKVME